MPPKKDPKKSNDGTVDGGNGPAIENESSGNGGTSSNNAVVPPGSGNGKGTEQQRTSSTSSAGVTPMEVDPANASVKEKVSHWANEVEKLCYSYGDQLMQVTQEKLETLRLVNGKLFKETVGSWGPIRKKIQPALNQCLVKLVEAVPEDFELDPPAEMAHPSVRAVAFRDLVENARTDVVGSLEELLQWVVSNAHDPAAILSLVGQKQASYTQIYDTVLGKMSRDILERMTDTESIQVDFGRDSDYGQALEAHQDLAKDRDDLELQLEGFQKHVEDLKASEADLYSKCTELQDKFSRAQADLLTCRDKVGILDAVTKFLDTDDTNAVGTLARIKDKHETMVDTIHKLEDKISELESHACPADISVLQGNETRIKDLELQLRAAHDSNVNLQQLVSDYQTRIHSGSGGTHQSLVERAREIGFIVDASGNLQLRPPRQVFDISKPYCYTSRNQSVPAPPPLKVFLGVYKEDQMGLSEFLQRYRHRYGPCSEVTKVEMLSEYLAGEAKKVYKSILSSWDGVSHITFGELESRMKNLMLDNSRTGALLKQQRVHSLRIKDDESYLSFITFLETKACEAYEDASCDTVDGVKIQVLLKNIRDPTLALQVEQALRIIPMGSPLFPTAKDLVIAYERTAKQARQWNSNAGSGSNRNNGKGSGRGKFQDNSSSQEKSGTKSSGIDGGAASPTNGNGGSAPPRSVPVCFGCHKPGHRIAESRSRNSPQLTGGNAVPAKFGNSGPVQW